MAYKKLMISLDEKLLAEIEEYAEKMHLNRSASIAVLCSTALEARKGMNTLDKLLNFVEEQKQD